jgi:hypothetical protein
VFPRRYLRGKAPGAARDPADDSGQTAVPDSAACEGFAMNFFREQQKFTPGPQGAIIVDEVI